MAASVSICNNSHICIFNLLEKCFLFLTLHSYSFFLFLYNFSHRLTELNVFLFYLIKSQCYQALWGLVFLPIPGEGLGQMGGLKFFTLLGETTRFSVLGDGGSPSSTCQKFTHPSPTKKSPPSRLPPPNFYHSTKGASSTK